MKIGAARNGARLGLAAVMALLGGCGLINAAINTAIPLAGAKLAFACIPEGVPVDTPDGPRAIETLRPGEFVIGFAGEPVRILQVHAYAEDPDATAFFGVRFETGERVDLCGMHRIAGVRARDLAPGSSAGGRVVLDVARYSGVERSYDLLTEDAGYRIAGLPVNSMIEEMMLAAREGRLP